MSNELPNKMSAALRLAVGDLKKCRADKTYVLDMSQWHDAVGRPDERCHVCIAGAVIAQSLGGDPNEDLYPGDYSSRYSNYEGSVGDKLDAINSMRQGSFLDAVDAFEGSDFSPTRGQRKAMSEARKVVRAAFSEKRDGGRATLPAYLKAARILEQAGL